MSNIRWELNSNGCYYAYIEYSEEPIRKSNDGFAKSLEDNAEWIKNKDGTWGTRFTTKMQNLRNFPEDEYSLRTVTEDEFEQTLKELNPVEPSTVEEIVYKKPKANKKFTRPLDEIKRLTKIHPYDM